MDLLNLVDPTTLCVSLLMLALCFLWAYVSWNSSKPEQPNLSALYEPITPGPKGNNGKKNNKPKPKKQVSWSLKMASRYGFLQCVVIWFSSYDLIIRGSFVYYQ